MRGCASCVVIHMSRVLTVTLSLFLLHTQATGKSHAGAFPSRPKQQSCLRRSGISDKGLRQYILCIVLNCVSIVALVYTSEYVLNGAQLGLRQMLSLRPKRRDRVRIL